MQRFSWTARDAKGATLQGQLEAIDAGATAAQLIARGLVPVSIIAGSANLASAGDDPMGALRRAWQQRAASRKASPESVTLAIRELAALLKAGIPMLRALRLVADASDSASLRLSFERVITDLDAGHTLAAAMEREAARGGPFKDFDVAMVRTGEDTGRLETALLELHHHREFMHATREQVKAALRYPMFVIGTCIAAMLVVNLFVMPAFAKVFANLRAELPLLTRVLLGSSKAVQQGWPYMLVGAVALFLAWRHWVSKPQGRQAWDKLLLRLPIAGPIVRRIVTARFAGSMSSTLGAGLTVMQALQVTSVTVGNAHVNAAIERIRHSVERGEPLSRAVYATHTFPPMVVQMVAIGEESGTLDELLGEIARHLHAEVEMAVRRLSGSIEPILIVLLGVGVAVMALGVFLPMWELGRANVK